RGPFGPRRGFICYSVTTHFLFGCAQSLKSTGSYSPRGARTTGAGAIGVGADFAATGVCVAETPGSADTTMPGSGSAAFSSTFGTAFDSSGALVRDVGTGSGGDNVLSRRCGLSASV